MPTASFWGIKMVALRGSDSGFAEVIMLTQLPKSPDPISASTMLFSCCAVALVAGGDGGGACCSAGLDTLDGGCGAGVDFLDGGGDGGDGNGGEVVGGEGKAATVNGLKTVRAVMRKIKRDSGEL